MNRPSLTLLALLSLAACEPAVPTEPPSPGAPRQEPAVQQQGWQTQGWQTQGWQTQGWQTQGTENTATRANNFDLKRYLASSIRNERWGEPASTVDDGRLEEGELVLARSLPTGTTASLTACTTTRLGEGRSCGFTSAGVGLCTPGSLVQIGPGGGCESKPVVRLCRGTAPCEYGSAGMIVSKAYGDPLSCPTIGFYCPASGTYNVLTAPFRSTDSINLKLAAKKGTYPHYNVLHRGYDLEGAQVTAEFQDGTSLDFLIARVVPEDDEQVPAVPSGYKGTTFRYEVQVPGPEGWVPLCAPDYDKEPVALPVRGWWDETGALHTDPGTFTFACQRGVVSKCYRWGYRPWDVASTTALQGHPVSLSEAHQTCTRMARADYCGDGRSFTYTGTPINLWDGFAPQVQSRDEKASEEYGLSFEAGWTPEGASCLSHARWDNAPEEVYDPYTCSNLYQDGEDGSLVPRYCEDEGEASEHAASVGRRAWLFNDSGHNVWDGREE